MTSTERLAAATTDHEIIIAIERAYFKKELNRDTPPEAWPSLSVHDVTKALSEMGDNESRNLADSLLTDLYDVESVWQPFIHECTVYCWAMVDPAGLPRSLMKPRSLMDCLEEWKRRRIEDDPELRFAFSPLVIEIIEQRLSQFSTKVDAVTHGSPIVPRCIAQVEYGVDSNYLRHYGPAAHQDLTGNLALGFEHESTRGPTLPDNIWRMGLDDSPQHRPAPPAFALRLFLTLIMKVQLEQRQSLYAVELRPTLGEVLEWVYGHKNVRPARYWPDLQDAREAFKDGEFVFERDGVLWKRQLVNMDLPLVRPSLDTPLRALIWLPSGETTGPQLRFCRLQYWGVRRAACYRALINLGFRSHIEGLRLMPVRKRKFWIPKPDPRVYDLLTDDIVDAYCFPAGTGKHRRSERIRDGWDAIGRLIKEGDARLVDGYLMPGKRILGP